MSDNIAVEISSAFLETCGDSTLLGFLARANVPLATLKKVRLVFPQTSASWKKSNGGPLPYIMPEYAIPCLLRDILHLQSLGIQVEVGKVTQDPSR